jgi:hypothetical protein
MVLIIPFISRIICAIQGVAGMAWTDNNVN